MGYKVIIQSVVKSGKLYKIIFSNHNDAGIQYETWAAAGSSSAVASAIKKMCDKRKAAGVYTPAED